MLKWLPLTLIGMFVVARGPCFAETLSLNAVLDEAVRQSYDLKLADVDIRLSRNEIKKVATDFLPQIRAQANLEYLRDLTNGQTPVAVVGTTAIPNVTRWQSLLYLTANWTVWDFGTRSRLLDAARSHKDAVRFYLNQYRRDLKMEVIDKYSAALLDYRALKAKERIVDLQRELFLMKKRLHLAGKISKVEVAEAGVELAKTFAEIHDLRQSLGQDLKALSVYTHKEYRVEDTEIMPIDDQHLNQRYVFAVEMMPEYRMYENEINRKRQELAALKRQRWPAFSLYTNYYMYGFDGNDLGQTFKTFQARTIAFGISASLPVFDAFKNRVEREKKQLEIERLQVERDKRLWELQEQHARLTNAVELGERQVKGREGLLAQGAEKVVMARRLSESELIEKTQYLAEQTQLIEHELELDKTRIQQTASLKKLQVLSEG